MKESVKIYYSPNIFGIGEEGYISQVQDGLYAYSETTNGNWQFNAGQNYATVDFGAGTDDGFTFYIPYESKPDTVTFSRYEESKLFKNCRCKTNEKVNQTL